MTTPTPAENHEIQKPDGDEPTTLATIRGLRERTITGKGLPANVRRLCVAHLTAEGYSAAEIAEIMTLSERTIIRDRKAIQEAYAIEPDPKLVPQFVGRLVMEADLVINRMWRAARDKGAEPGTRIDAEHRCYQVISDVLQRLQSLGYMPTAAQRVEASLKHQIDDLPPLDGLFLEMSRLRVVAQESQNGEMVQKLGELERITAHANLASTVAQLTAAQPAKEDDHAPAA
ncbi:MAG: hypothetical protein L0219_04200 [Phycisphaerales bacterium]|nr:hypothetical protein [Phycisphaerales bacterium]